MYAFDENGNVLIDNTQTQLIANANRNRTISRRAQALSNNQYTPFQPVSHNTWALLNSRLGTMFTEIFHRMKVPTRGTVSAPRGANDFRSIYFKALHDWASVDLQGFNGPIPATEINGLTEVVFFLPADGAVIRYLGRLLRKYPGFFDIRIGQGNTFNSRVATLDNSSAVVGENIHGMCIRVREQFANDLGGRFDGNVGTLKAILRTMDIGQVINGVNKVLSTLTRKIRSHDGTWGEDPKFPIVNFNRKVNFRDWRVLTEYDQNFHGNNKDLYSDRNVYSVIASGDKLPFTQTSGSSGEYKWTQPRS